MTEPPTINAEESVKDNSAKESNIQNFTFWQKVKLAFEGIKPILTSHHPSCEYYKDHTFHLFGQDWCIGCYIGYPSAILMLIIGYLTGIFQSLNTGTLYIIAGSLISTYILSIVGLTKIRWIKIISKIFIGAGAAFIIAGFFSLPAPGWLSFLLSFMVLQPFLLAINVKRGIEMRKTCAECEYESDHDNCTGMHMVMEKLNKIRKTKKKV